MRCQIMESLRYGKVCRMVKEQTLTFGGRGVNVVVSVDGRLMMKSSNDPSTFYRSAAATTRPNQMVLVLYGPAICE